MRVKAASRTTAITKIVRGESVLFIIKRFEAKLRNISLKSIGRNPVLLPGLFESLASFFLGLLRHLFSCLRFTIARMCFCVFVLIRSAFIVFARGEYE